MTSLVEYIPYDKVTKACFTKKDTVVALHGIYCSNERFLQFTPHRSGRRMEAGLVSGGNKETTTTGTTG